MNKITLLALLTAGQFWAQTNSCAEIKNEEKAQLVKYVVKRYGMPATVTIDIIDVVPASGCYSKVVFAGKGPVGPVSLALYLSPDHRYLSPDVFDTAIDPAVEAESRARQNLDRLTQGEFASNGDKDAQVVVVEFSDFQCPYCKQAAEVIRNEPLIQDGAKVRLVYRHFPLAQHDWAQPAAEAAACAQFQSSDVFWKMHDALFGQQSAVTNTNASAKIREIAAGIPGLDQGKFKECVDRDLSLGTVMRDKRLGDQLKVNGTPTLFVNGRMIQPSDLHAAILDELQRKKPAQTQGGSIE